MTAIALSQPITKLELAADHFYSAEYIKARRRVCKQLIQALIYENSIEYQEMPLADGVVEFRIQGLNNVGQAVVYSAKGHRRTSFGRVEFSNATVSRLCAGQSKELQSIREFLTETANSFLITVEFMERFIQELEHTLAKDAAALFYARSQYEKGRIGTLRSMAYDNIESNLLKAHPYHPCYKSRIGFDALDNFRYGPEFSPDISLIWLALKKSHCLSIYSQELNDQEFYVQQLGEQLKDFNRLLDTYHCAAEDYVFMPVHPWQWLHQISPLYTADLHQKNIIVLGEGIQPYRPQQSIRTLANKNHPGKHYVKLALSIVNTSTSRGLAEHTIANAPVISDWLYRLVAGDQYLKNQQKTILLREVKAISFSSASEAIASGKIACLWRESLNGYLKSHEGAIPFSGLTEIDRDNQPVVQEWILEYGIHKWIEQLLKVSVLPLVRLLYAHGVALESHAQNMILIHEDGWPTRIALKDFHDGVRFMPEHVTHNELLNTLQATPRQHLATNSSSYISASDPEDVKNFLYSAFFSMNLSEFALFFDMHYGIAETLFWRSVKNCIAEYQREFPEQQARYCLFNLQSEFVTVEAHTKRRLQNESSVRINRVKNPLYRMEVPTHE